MRGWIIDALRHLQTIYLAANKKGRKIPVIGLAEPLSDLTTFWQLPHSQKSQIL